LADFRPIFRSYPPGLVIVYESDLVTEVHTEFGDPAWIKQITRLTDGMGYVEVEYVVGPVPVDDGIGKEVILKYSTTIESICPSRPSQGPLRRRSVEPSNPSPSHPLPSPSHRKLSSRPLPSHPIAEVSIAEQSHLLSSRPLAVHCTKLHFLSTTFRNQP